MSETSIAQRRANRNRSVRVRLSEAEFAALTTFAEEAARPLAKCCGDWREAGGFGPTFEGEVAQRLKSTVVQLRKVGVNLNQIARALNSGRAPSYEHLKVWIERLARLVAQHERDLDELRARSRARSRRLVGTNV
ncbi:MobC family plasmid mobilization relaxosome protein [Rhizobium beringeri]